MLSPGQQINARATAERVLVQAPDRREEAVSNGVEAPAGVGDNLNG
jgi:hypothetical protein